MLRRILIYRYDPEEVDALLPVREILQQQYGRHASDALIHVEQAPDSSYTNDLEML